MSDTSKILPKSLLLTLPNDQYLYILEKGQNFHFYTFNKVDGITIKDKYSKYDITALNTIFSRQLSSEYNVVNNVIELMFDENLKFRGNMLARAVRTGYRGKDVTWDDLEMELEGKKIKLINREDYDALPKHQFYRLEYDNDDVNFIYDRINNVITIDNYTDLKNFIHYGYLIIDNKLYINDNHICIGNKFLGFIEEIISYKIINNANKYTDYEYTFTDADKIVGVVEIFKNSNYENVYKIFSKFSDKILKYEHISDTIVPKLNGTEKIKVCFEYDITGYKHISIYVYDKFDKKYLADYIILNDND